MPRPSRSAGQNPPVTSSHPSNASAAAHSTHTQNVHRNFGIGTLATGLDWRPLRGKELNTQAAKARAKARVLDRIDSARQTRRPEMNDALCLLVTVTKSSH